MRKISRCLIFLYLQHTFLEGIFYAVENYYFLRGFYVIDVKRVFIFSSQTDFPASIPFLALNHKWTFYEFNFEYNICGTFIRPALVPLVLNRNNLIPVPNDCVEVLYRLFTRQLFHSLVYIREESNHLKKKYFANGKSKSDGWICTEIMRRINRTKNWFNKRKVCWLRKQSEWEVIYRKNIWPLHHFRVNVIPWSRSLMRTWHVVL